MIYVRITENKEVYLLIESSVFVSYTGDVIKPQQITQLSCNLQAKNCRQNKKSRHLISKSPAFSPASNHFDLFFILSLISLAKMAKTPPTVAIRTLNLELKKLQEEPVEGFTVSTNDDNLFHWKVAIFGPPDTLYQGGYFKAEMKFPHDYPYSPPSFRFLTKMWHPNIYDSGDVCISILHPPVDDPRSGELASERWNPTQSVRTILLSVISLLNEPNTFSPANVDASVMYRRWKESKEKDYEHMIRKQVQVSKEEAKKDNVVVPLTLNDYCIKTKRQSQPQSSDVLDEDFAYDDDYDDDDDESDEEEEEVEDEEKAKINEDDSGNEDS